MPSFTHESLLQLVRNCPGLAAELLRQAQIELLLLVDDVPVLGIVIEVQLTPKPRKRFTWPLYLTSLRAKLECDTCLLVIAPSMEVARWAAEPIRIGPGSTVVPLVVDPRGIPVVTDRERAIQTPELAVLSALAHGQGDVETAVKIALAAAAGVDTVPEDRAVLYSDLITAALSEAARKAFFMLPQGYQFQSEIGRESFQKGVAQGIEQGIEQGVAQGVAQGRAADVLEVLDARGLTVTDAERERILGCADLGMLARWIRRAATVAATDALFE